MTTRKLCIIKCTHLHITKPIQVKNKTNMQVILTLILYYNEIPDTTEVLLLAGLMLAGLMLATIGPGDSGFGYEQILITHKHKNLT